MVCASMGKSITSRAEASRHISRTPSMTRLLLVEDSPTQAQELIYILQDTGFEVEWVENGQLAFERLLGEPFDLVLTDLFLPGDSGVDLCRHIKADPSRGDIPVV